MSIRWQDCLIGLSWAHSEKNCDPLVALPNLFIVLDLIGSQPISFNSNDAVSALRDRMKGLAFLYIPQRSLRVKVRISSHTLTV